jgi:hypothetical protein
MKARQAHYNSVGTLQVRVTFAFHSAKKDNLSRVSSHVLWHKTRIFRSWSLNSSTSAQNVSSQRKIYSCNRNLIWAVAAPPFCRVNNATSLSISVNLSIGSSDRNESPLPWARPIRATTKKSRIRPITGYRYLCSGARPALVFGALTSISLTFQEPPVTIPSGYRLRQKRTVFAIVAYLDLLSISWVSSCSGIISRFLSLFLFLFLTSLVAVTVFWVEM